MGDGARQRIGGIRAGGARQGEKAAYHVLNLRFVGVTIPDHGLFDLQGGVFGHFNTTGNQCADRRAARLAEQ